MWILYVWETCIIDGSVLRGYPVNGKRAVLMGSVSCGYEVCNLIVNLMGVSHNKKKDFLFLYWLS